MIWPLIAINAAFWYNPSQQYIILKRLLTASNAAFWDGLSPSFWDGSSQHTTHLAGTMLTCSASWHQHPGYRGDAAYRSRHWCKWRQSTNVWTRGINVPVCSTTPPTTANRWHSEIRQVKVRSTLTSVRSTDKKNRFFLLYMIIHVFGLAEFSLAGKMLMATKSCYQTRLLARIFIL